MELSSAPFLARLTLALQADDWQGFEQSIEGTAVDELTRTTRFAAATCLHLANGSSRPWLERLLQASLFNAASLRQSNLLCVALESGAYDCVGLLWKHGVRIEHPDRWNSLMVQALAHDTLAMGLADWPAEARPGEALVAQAAAFRLLNTAFDPTKLQAIGALRQKEWKGFAFEICLTLLRSPSLALKSFSLLQPGMTWALDQGWVTPGVLEAALKALPEPNSDFESQQREDAIALNKALLTLHRQRNLDRTLEPAEGTQGRGRQRL